MSNGGRGRPDVGRLKAGLSKSYEFMGQGRNLEVLAKNPASIKLYLVVSSDMAQRLNEILILKL